MIYNYTYKLYYFIVHKLNENDSIFLFYSNTWFYTDFLYIDFVTNQIINFQQLRQYVTANLFPIWLRELKNIWNNLNK